MQVKSGVLGMPSYTRVWIRNRFRVVARAIVLVVIQFPNPLTIMVRSNPSSVIDSILKISELDCDMFILVRAEVPNFQDHFRFSSKIFSLTSLFYFSFHTWLHPVFLLLSIIFTLLNKKNKR